MRAKQRCCGGPGNPPETRTLYNPFQPPTSQRIVVELTHFNADGEARMVDVSDKPDTHRIAVAEGRIHMQAETLQQVRDGTSRKGDVLAVARVAGIMAAKRTPDLIPLCHPLPLNHVSIEFLLEETPPAVCAQARCETHANTGVEMEALTAVHIALLTIYDMCKAIDRGMQIDGIALLRKSGGRSGDWSRDDT